MNYVIYVMSYIFVTKWKIEVNINAVPYEDESSAASLTKMDAQHSQVLNEFFAVEFPCVWVEVIDQTAWWPGSPQTQLVSEELLQYVMQ